MEIKATCSLCGREETFELTNEESKRLIEYRNRGREMGFIQNLFPRVPA